MNCRYFMNSIAVLLINCLLGIGGFASSHSVIHEWHHTHHEQTTHGTVLCSWMCIAGQVIDDVVVPQPVALIPVERVAVEFFHFPLFVVHHKATSRGPPFQVLAIS